MIKFDEDYVKEIADIVQTVVYYVDSDDPIYIKTKGDIIKEIERNTR